MTDLTKLSEKAAKFLGNDYTKDICQFLNDEDLRKACTSYEPLSPSVYFDNPQTAPILAHLAKREMEKRDYKWEQIHGQDADCFCKFVKRSYSMDYFDFVSDKNEYKALWLAIEQTGVLDEN